MSGVGRVGPASAECDVAVIGLGGMGSSAAWHLARRGHRVVGVEQFGPAHDRGSSHGETRLVRQAYFEDPRYVPLLLRSYEIWDELGSITGTAHLTRTGGLMVGPAGGAVVTGTVASATRWQIPHEVLDAGEAASRFPTFRLGADELAVFEPGAGFVDPESTVATHVELAAAAGARLEFHTEVLDWALGRSGPGSGSDGTVSVRTRGGVLSARRLVICAGPWSGRVLQDLGLPLSVERHALHWFAPTGDAARFGLGHHPVYLWEYAEGAELYGFPVLPGAAGAKAAFFHHGRPADPDRLDRTVTADEGDALRAELAGRLPGLAGRWLSGKACMYTMTPDRHFVIGTVPGTDGRVIVAGGFSGHGFKFVPVVGEILADLATTGRTGHDISLFEPSRFT